MRIICFYKGNFDNLMLLFSLACPFVEHSNTLIIDNITLQINKYVQQCILVITHGCKIVG